MISLSFLFDFNQNFYLTKIALFQFTPKFQKKARNWCSKLKTTKFSFFVTFSRPSLLRKIFFQFVVKKKFSVFYQRHKFTFFLLRDHHLMTQLFKSEVDKEN